MLTRSPKIGERKAPVSCWHQKRPTNKPANFLRFVE
nr:MAG TPA: hypothetical protein [Caudoviricetes sp.]